MPRKADLRQVDSMCRQHHMTPDQERRFRRLLHELKAAGEFGTANERGDFTWDELDSLASEYMSGE